MTSEPETWVDWVGVAVGLSCVVGAIVWVVWLLATAPEDSCAEWVRGTVAMVDDHGRPAQVQRTWCATYKPGREPDGGSR